MSDNWWEIGILCDPSLEELIFARLEKFGCQGTAVEVKGQSCLVKAYIPQNSAHLLDLAALALWIKQDAYCFAQGSPVQISQPMVQWHLMDEEDWSSNWKKHWQPKEIGDTMIIYPAWIIPPDDEQRMILKLDPGVAFGTGEHATTQLCLEALEMRLSDVNVENLKIVDIGCGSGILAIAAAKFGVKQVYGVDNDPLAVKAANENRELNGVDEKNLIIREGSVETLAAICGGKVDGIVCNILAEVIIDLIPQISELAKPTTWGIFSGILLDQAKGVTDVLESHGWTVGLLWKQQDWCCLNVRRK
jgi:ribosomal protein L11 methyltransferase